MKILLSPGTYYFGFKLGLLGTRVGAIKALQDAGFTNTNISDRFNVPPIDPKSAKGYNDDWDYWASADYNGKPQIGEVTYLTFGTPASSFAPEEAIKWSLATIKPGTSPMPPNPKVPGRFLDGLDAMTGLPISKTTEVVMEVGAILMVYLAYREFVEKHG